MKLIACIVITLGLALTSPLEAMNQSKIGAYQRRCCPVCDICKAKKKTLEDVQNNLCPDYFDTISQQHIKTIADNINTKIQTLERLHLPSVDIALSELRDISLLENIVTLIKTKNVNLELLEIFFAQHQEYDSIFEAVKRLHHEISKIPTPDTWNIAATDTMIQKITLFDALIFAIMQKDDAKIASKITEIVSITEPQERGR